MAVSIKTLGIDRLGIQERLDLVEEIWDTIAADSRDVPLTNPQRAELDRRITDSESNPNDVIPWADIKATAVEQLNK